MTSTDGSIPGPRVSVVMPAYEAAAFVENALASLAAQTLGDWEAIVVDDASSDRTAEVVAAVAARDPRVRLVRQTENGGPAVARNRALAEARGRWIALLDADDLYLPDRLERLVALGEREGLDLVADNLWMKDPADGRIVRSGLPQDGTVRDWTLLDLLDNDLPARGFVFGLLKPIIRAEFLAAHHLAWPADLRYGEDFVFYAELFLHGARARISSRPGYVYVLPISEADGSRSEHSRTRMRGLELIRDGEVLLAKHGDRLGPKERAAIDRRRRYLEHADAARDLKARLHDRDVVGALRMLAAHPFLMRYLVRGAVWRLAVRFGRYGGPKEEAEKRA